MKMKLANTCFLTVYALRVVSKSEQPYVSLRIMLAVRANIMMLICAKRVIDSVA